MYLNTRKVGDNLRKFYKVTNCETGSSELVLADGHVDALSFYRKKNNVEKSVILECADCFVYNNDGNRYAFTKLSELRDNDLFYKALPALGWCGNSPIFKICTKANDMVACRYLYDTIRPDSYFKGSTYVTIIPRGEQECLKSPVA